MSERETMWILYDGDVQILEKQAERIRGLPLGLIFSPQESEGILADLAGAGIGDPLGFLQETQLQFEWNEITKNPPRTDDIRILESFLRCKIAEVQGTYRNRS